METFTELKPFVDNPLYQEQREKALSGLDINTIDAPMIEIINGFAKLPYCFTLQSCYGHFVHNNQKSPKNVEPLSGSDNISSIEINVIYFVQTIKSS